VVAVHTRRIEPAPVARLVQSQSQGLTQGQSQAQSQSDPTRPMENTGS
jgi:hypothetical protein